MQNAELGMRKDLRTRLSRVPRPQVLRQRIMETSKRLTAKAVGLFAYIQKNKSRLQYRQWNNLHPIVAGVGHFAAREDD